VGVNSIGCSSAEVSHWQQEQITERDRVGVVTEVTPIEGRTNEREGFYRLGVSLGRAMRKPKAHGARRFSANPDGLTFADTPRMGHRSHILINSMRKPL